jgi:predicted nucleic acid-binding protein
VREAVLDASVAAKFFLEEEGSELARSLEHGYDLSAPELILAELCNLFWKRIRKRDMFVTDAHAALERLPNVLDLIGLEQIAPEAIRLSATLDHPAYDCFYLALAYQQNRPLLTADAKLAILAEAARLDVSVIRLDQLEN